MITKTICNQIRKELQKTSNVYLVSVVEIPRTEFLEKVDGSEANHLQCQITLITSGLSKDTCLDFIDILRGWVEKGEDKTIVSRSGVLH